MATSTPASAEVKALVDSKIADNKVMVFSKSYCPYCVMAKKELNKHPDLVAGKMEVLEMENMSECQAMQDYLKEITGGRTVPRVFINGKFVGGGSEVKSLEASGELK